MFYTETFESAPPASAAARRLAERLGDAVDEETMANLRLLVSELVTNSVEHVAGGEPIVLTVALEDGTVHVEVSDRGPGFQYRPREAGDPQDSGWGLHFVERLSGRWGSDAQDGSRVWFEMPARVPAHRP